METTNVQTIEHDDKTKLLWYCKEEVKEFGNITADTLAACKESKITLEEINEAISSLGVVVTEY